MWAASIPPVFGAAASTHAFRKAFSRFATGVCVVTSSGPDGPAGLTANSVTSLSLEPPLMIVCFDRESRTLPAVDQSRRFAVHFLAHDQEELAARFASKRPEVEKFAGAQWTQRAGVPVLDGCIGGLVCELTELVPGGDHLIAIGQVVDIWQEEGEPLVFYSGDYWRLSGREAAPAEVDEALEP
jgi:flavin reductase (DIM6/NTAB) family NADH-FMN oxidoreductase RutF